LTMAAADAIGWLATAGVTVAGAATSSHMPTPAGSDIMALAGLAVSAVIFLILIFLRRRTPTA
jgi:hypothetical protein